MWMILENYRNRLSHGQSDSGKFMREHSLRTMDATFRRDPAYRKSKINAEYVDTKFLAYTKNSISKDAIDYHLVFRPGVTYPLGTYVDIPVNQDDEYTTWLIVDRDNHPIFFKYNILLCNWLFKWIANGKVRSCLGAIRSRNSYNSGVWADERLSLIVGTL